MRHAQATRDAISGLCGYETKEIPGSNPPEWNMNCWWSSHRITHRIVCFQYKQTRNCCFQTCLLVLSQTFTNMLKFSPHPWFLFNFSFVVDCGKSDIANSIAFPMKGRLVTWSQVRLTTRKWVADNGESLISKHLCRQCQITFSKPNHIMIL